MKGAVSDVAEKRAWIALGGNLGDRIGMIEQACKEMSARGIQVKRTSSLWETEPMYVLEQENFINGVCEVKNIFIKLIRALLLPLLLLLTGHVYYFAQS